MVRAKSNRCLLPGRRYGTHAAIQKHAGRHDECCAKTGGYLTQAILKDELVVQLL